MLGSLCFQLAKIETEGSTASCALFQRGLALFERVVAAGSLGDDRSAQVEEAKARIAACEARSAR